MKSYCLILNFVAYLCLATAEDIELDTDTLNEKLKDKGVHIEKAIKIEEEKGVLVLTDDNFDDLIESNEFILVEFYAPWCGHCKKLEPEYAEAAKIILDRNFPCKLAKLDATVHKVVAGKFGIQGYPTLKFFKNGKPTEYTGSREAHGIVQWLEKKTGPPALEVDQPQTVEDRKNTNDFVVLGCLEDENHKKIFSEVAEDIQDMQFLVSSNEKVLESNECKLGSIILFKDFDEPRVEYTGEIKKTELKKWIEKTTTPLVWIFDEKTAPKIFGQKVKVHFLYFTRVDTDEELNEEIKQLKTVAEVYNDKLVFVAVNRNTQVQEFFGLTNENLPSYGIYEMEGNAKYMEKPNTKIDRNTVVKFLKKFLNKELEKTLKSEEIPEDWDKEPVKVLVGKNFEAVAKDKTKHVFVEFYAPWCGHCKSLAPIWDDLGKKFKDNNEVIIAKMDSTANEVSDVSISGFPTLKLIKKDTNKIIDYEGKRELEDLTKFIENILKGGDGGEVNVDSEGDEEEEEVDEDLEDEWPVNEDDKSHDEL